MYLVTLATPKPTETDPPPSRPTPNPANPIPNPLRPGGKPRPNLSRARAVVKQEGKDNDHSRGRQTVEEGQGHLWRL